MVAVGFITRPDNTPASRLHSAERRSIRSGRRNSYNPSKLDLRTHQGTSTEPSIDRRRTQGLQYPTRRNTARCSPPSNRGIRLRGQRRVHLGAATSCERYSISVLTSINERTIQGLYWQSASCQL